MQFAGRCGYANAGVARYEQAVCRRRKVGADGNAAAAVNQQFGVAVHLRPKGIGTSGTVDVQAIRRCSGADADPTLRGVDDHALAVVGKEPQGDVVGGAQLGCSRRITVAGKAPEW